MLTPDIELLESLWNIRNTLYEMHTALNKSVLPRDTFTLASPVDKAIIIALHQLCSHHKEYVNNSEYVGCFDCCTIFKPNEITDWCDRKGDTALCPHCKTDMIIPQDHNPIPLTVELLELMYEYWLNHGYTFKDGKLSTERIRLH